MIARGQAETRAAATAAAAAAILSASVVFILGPAQADICINYSRLASSSSVDSSPVGFSIGREFDI